MILKTLRRKLRKSRAPSPEHVRVGPSQEELTLTTELRNILSTFQPCSRLTAHPTSWTLLLPPELIYLIIDRYYSDDSELETLRALACTCKILASYCRRYIYRTVNVGPRTATVVHNTFIPERFARLVVQAPHILPHIQNLHITMQNRGRRAKFEFDPLSREEESIAFLLARCMKNLRRFKITTGVDWILLPDRLQDAITTTFQSPVLNDVIIEGIRNFPLTLLLHVKRLEHLDFRCDAAPPSNQQESSFTVQPKMIYLHDPRASTVRYLFGERSSLSTSQLYGLSVFGNGRVVSTLETYFPSFSSLTRLELDPGTLGGGTDRTFLCFFTL